MNNIIIFSIAFCDLAGSERLKKTMNIGDRLIESKKINTSLMVLNKCFSVLRYVYISNIYINIPINYFLNILFKVRIKNAERIN